MRIVDFHNHVLPGVDDGARDVGAALAALRAFRAEGVGTVVATPHFEAARVEVPGAVEERLAEFDAALVQLQAALTASGLDVRLERGAEVRLDAPEPDFSDGRLRLAGTRFALVEFPSFDLPPYGGGQLAALRRDGWLPILAHPERYRGLAAAIERAEEWTEHAYLQVNSGALLGQFGAEAQRAARALLGRGWVSYLASDYHTRGRPAVSEARALLLAAEGRPTGEPADQVADADGPGEAEPGSLGRVTVAELLMEVNPARMLRGEEPLPVPPLELPAGILGAFRRVLR